jgi:hypothetical protein
LGILLIIYINVVIFRIAYEIIYCKPVKPTGVELSGGGSALLILFITLNPRSVPARG